jgi:hypothetical protein
MHSNQCMTAEIPFTQLSTSGDKKSLEDGHARANQSLRPVLFLSPGFCARLAASLRA